jgi:hypothetical protein
MSGRGGHFESVNAKREASSSLLCAAYLTSKTRVVQSGEHTGQRWQAIKNLTPSANHLVLCSARSDAELVRSASADADGDAAAAEIGGCFPIEC